MNPKLFVIGLAALILIGCSDSGNTSGTPQAAAEGQDNGVMALQNGTSSRPMGESMH